MVSLTCFCVVLRYVGHLHYIKVHCQFLKYVQPFCSLFCFSGYHLRQITEQQVSRRFHAVPLSMGYMYIVVLICFSCNDRIFAVNFADAPFVETTFRVPVIYVAPGQDATIECYFSANPDVDLVRWYHNKSELIIEHHTNVKDSKTDFAFYLCSVILAVMQWSLFLIKKCSVLFLCSDFCQFTTSGSNYSWPIAIV